MISIAAVSGDGASYYAADNYYTAREGTEQSAWLGKAAEDLGLAGIVDPDVFERILAGKLPDGTQLDARRGEHRPGLDLTFSASKSVSLLALVGGDKRIVAELRGAVASTLGWIETNLAETRVWNGSNQVTERTGNLLAATFLHDVNRNQEPQLHIHAVIANVTKGSDGKWHALKNDELYARQHTISAVFNAELRSRIEGLGYNTQPARNPIDGAFEITGVNRDVIDAFSTRSQEIRAALQAEGRSSPRERELVALTTRRSKDAIIDPEERGKGWAKLAEKCGLDAKELVREAIGRLDKGQSMWGRVVEGIRGVGAKGQAMAAAMGLSPRDGDVLVPERLGRLAPRDYAAAQAVASASRELSEREAGFDRLDLIGKALDRIGPVTVTGIEARIDLLQQKGLLLGTARMVTPEMMVRLEQAILAHLRDARGVATPLLDRPDAAVRVQEAARELGLRRLNPGQQGAAVDILSTSNRVHYVQGGAGVGKSAALGPVAAVAHSTGHRVHALAIATRTAREFGEKIGAPGQSIASFLARHARVLDGTASPDRLAAAREEIAGSFIMVDEASMVPNHQFEQILRLGNILGAERVIMAGDTRQLLAIEAGKPFEVTQEHGAPISHITENLRAASPLMKTVNAALEQGDIAKAFEALKDNTLEVRKDAAASHAAELWTSLPKDRRENTVLLALSRSMRGAVNEAVQQRLKMAGEIGRDGLRLAVHDRVMITREGARQMRAYQDGRVVEFNTSLPRQGFVRGDRGVVIGQEGRVVSLRMPDGTVRALEPHRFARNLKHDAVSIHQEKQLSVHEGDRIRWTANDKERGLLNNQLAQVQSVHSDRVTVRTTGGQVHDLKAGDPMLEKLDLAYALTVHAAQGLTSESGILVMREEERLLNSARSFLVAATRVANDITLVVDNAGALERGIARNAGGKTSALEIAGNLPDMPRSELMKLALKLGFEPGNGQMAGKERDLALEKELGRDREPQRGEISRDFQIER
ncbi:MobF family relaxase [Novosphingobium beihaiensis]|uniref:Conjugative relaxase n=1 Tax=Novosphingobium beihaiensis TaxID=2930389 RepID=A0ABT0BU96_9SPHN|nr:MobF family relaxase [Novosphingobium beihaiensis]MCJ2188597.1 conjugative relaxase [Novosphingobium beihaiensis]